MVARGRVIKRPAGLHHVGTGSGWPIQPDRKPMLWRCHYWDEPMCSIYKFDKSKLIRDGYTRCMINCYRDTSLMQLVGVWVHDVYQAFRKGKVVEGTKALAQRAISIPSRRSRKSSPGSCGFEVVEPHGATAVRALSPSCPSLREVQRLQIAKFSELRVGLIA